MHDDRLCDTVLRQLGVRDAINGTIDLNTLTPFLTSAFHVRWQLAQQHQAALLQAADQSDLGALTLTQLGTVAAFVKSTLSQDKLPETGSVEQVFQSACALDAADAQAADTSSDTCSLAGAKLALFAWLGKPWTLISAMPSGKVLDDSGAPQLPEAWEFELSDRARAMQNPVARAMEFRVHCPCIMSDHGAMNAVCSCRLLMHHINKAHFDAVCRSVPQLYRFS